MYKKLACLLLIAVMIFSNSFGGTTGKIKGRIVDKKTGEPISDCNIILKNTVLGASTNANGEFFIINIPPGVYELEASYVGYKTQLVQNVKVNVDLTTTINFIFEEEVIEGEVITIVAQKPIIQKDASATAAVITTEDLKELPIESFQAAVATKAGVNVGANGALHIRGGRSNEILYMIDGIPTNNPFSNGNSIDVATNSIEELSVISGSFNAEYGKAQSGVINIVTKEGYADYTGQISVQTGDVITSNEDLFLNIDDRDPLNTRKIEVNFGGPVPGLRDKASFYLSGRLWDDNGYLYGQRRYGLPVEVGNVLEPTPGDSSYVAMNPYRKINLHAKLSYKILPGMKATYTGLFTDIDRQSYVHTKKFAPDGRLNYYTNSQQHTLSLVHQLNKNMFYTFRGSYLRDHYRYNAYENMYDENYLSSYYAVQADQWNGFLMGGSQNGREDDLAETWMAKLDLTSQFNNSNMIKTGFEYKKIRLDQNYLWLDRSLSTGNFIIPEGGRTYNTYVKEPWEFSAYIQDKIELREMVINLGLRFDYLNPNDEVPVDFDDLTSGNMRKVDAKSKFSPRFSMAYPVTDMSKIFISYGHFFQLPPYNSLYLLNEAYNNPNGEIRTGILSTIIGNVDLKPQKTISYEVGYEQQIAENIGLFVKGYYRDMRHLLDTRLHTLPNGTIYAAYTNVDYGNVRGVTFTLTKRMSNYFSGSIDYTYQIAEGNSSSPNQVYLNARSETQDEAQVVFLNWDQPHSLRMNFNLATPGGFGAGIIGIAESGYPYTPAASNENVGINETNSGRKPPKFNVNLNLHKDFDIKFQGRDLQYRIYLKVYNLLDRLNENYVFDSTGRAGYTLNKSYSDEYIVRPQYYSKPRSVYIGSSITF